MVDAAGTGIEGLPATAAAGKLGRCGVTTRGASQTRLIVAGALIWTSVSTGALCLLLGWSLMLSWYASVSVLTFACYGIDKWRASHGGWRVPEALLHSWALIGGFVGAWLGRWLFNHKTRKVGFTVVLLIATIIHLVVLARVLAASGRVPV